MSAVDMLLTCKSVTSFLQAYTCLCRATSFVLLFTDLAIDGRRQEEEQRLITSWRCPSSAKSVTIAYTMSFCLGARISRLFQSVTAPVYLNM